MNVNIGADMLRKSAGIIEERQKAYGPPAKNFANIAKLWTGWLTSRYGELASIDLDGTDVAVMNNLQKIARLAETPDHEDSWVDVAGYAACGLQVQKAEPAVDAIDWGDISIDRTPMAFWNTEPVPVEMETTGPLVGERTEPHLPPLRDHGSYCKSYSGLYCNCHLSKQTS